MTKEEIIKIIDGDNNELEFKNLIELYKTDESVRNIVIDIKKDNLDKARKGLIGHDKDLKKDLIKIANKILESLEKYSK